jgi:hypothetical protein
MLNLAAATLVRPQPKRPAKSRTMTPPVDAVIPFRIELVQRVRQAIASGEYDTPERLALAVDNLSCRLNRR